MTDELLALLTTFGAEGVTLMYYYITLKYLTDVIAFSVTIWGIRTLWKYLKEINFFK